MYTNFKQDVESRNYTNIVLQITNQEGSTVKAEDVLPVLQDANAPQWLKNFLAAHLAVRTTAGAAGQQRNVA